MMSWFLINAGTADFDELMTWFPDAHSVDIWGGPAFRFPYDRDSFREDCRWQDFSSYCLRSPDNCFAAFGQVGSRYGRSHLARLVANPDMRRRGVGRKLIEMLIATARADAHHDEVGLFVYRDNVPAYRCYLASGFEVQNFPADAPMADRCLYLTRNLLPIT